jgi:metal-dependent amidase/aminoacylase/carboxypeptidase family protein
VQNNRVLETLTDLTAKLEDVYRDLHQHPELSMAEHRTAGVVGESLRRDGYEVTTGVGGTGVVGLLRRGEGPAVMLRADMDALPIKEDTGLPTPAEPPAPMPPVPRSP